jgi:exosortase A-associated hydrolase 2
LAPARPFFLPAGPRALFALHHEPTAPVRGAIVYVPPFGEEMNKSRRMAALQARALAAAGWHVLQIDLFGTGDSEGDFAEATWDAWLEDIATAVGFSSAQYFCQVFRKYTGKTPGEHRQP